MCITLNSTGIWRIFVVDPETSFLVFGAYFTGCLEKASSICLCLVSELIHSSSL